MKFTVTGLDRVLKNFDRASSGMQNAVAAAVYQEALDITAESKKRVPVATGRLRNTGYAAPPVKTSKGPESESGFGTDYGLAVHERLEVFHRVGGPKYLESVANEHKRGYKKRMAARAAFNFKTGIGVRAIPADQPKRPSR